MKETDKLTVPILAITVTYKKLPIHKKIAGIVLSLLAGTGSFLWLFSPYNIVVWSSPWIEILFYILFCAVLLFAAASLVCAIAGYTRLKFTAAAASATALLWILNSIHYYRCTLLDDNSVAIWFVRNAPMYLIAFTAVFLLGRFVLFKTPSEEQKTE